MYELRVESRFSAAHRLRGYDGKCERLHGHNYRVELVLGCGELNGLGVVMDFQDLKDVLGKVVGRIDHRYLNEVEPFDTVNPTAEQIARHVCEAAACRLPDGVTVRKVTCWESETCAASYVPDGRPGPPTSAKEQAT